MQTFLHGRDLIGDLDFTKEEVETVLDVAIDLKRKRALNEPHPYLRDKVLAMLFFFSSTRTRGSFEAGMAQLGGHGAFIESKSTQISHGDTPKEIGEIFGRYYDGIAANCPVAEDFSAPLGDPTEKLTAAASTYLESGACPPVAAASEDRTRALALTRRARATTPEPGERRGMWVD